MAVIDDEFAAATTCVNGDVNALLTQLLAAQVPVVPVPPTVPPTGGPPTVPPGPITGPISGPFQISLGGVLMDAVECNVPLSVTRWFSGLGVAPKRDNDRKRMQHHGSFASPQYLDVRHLLWDVMPQGDGPADFNDAVRALCAAFVPRADTFDDPTVPLLFTLDDPAVQYVVFGKPGQVPVDYGEFLHSIHFARQPLVTTPITCEFIATDPVIYSADLHEDQTGLGASSGGFAFPLGFPFDFGTSIPGTTQAVNAGNMTTYPILTFTAAAFGLSDIQVINDDTGETWSITLSLAPADILVVDMNAHTVLLNGSSRGAFVNRPPSVWFGLEPGATDLSFLGTGLGATMKVQWRDAWQF